MPASCGREGGRCACYLCVVGSLKVSRKAIGGLGEDDKSVCDLCLRSP